MAGAAWVLFSAGRSGRVVARAAGLLAITALLAAPEAALGALLFPGTTYSQASDSPFDALSFDYFHLEDFEDGLLNATGLTGVGGSVFASFPNNIDSVDLDDGVADNANTGDAGNSYLNQTSSTVVFDFSLTTLGVLPTHAGLVWTDGGTLTGPTGLSGSFTFEAFDGSFASIGSITRTVGDGDFTGQTLEDRFFGASHGGGIARITLTYDSPPESRFFEVDHVQYGALPEPAASVLLAIGLATIPVVRRRSTASTR